MVQALMQYSRLGYPSLLADTYLDFSYNLLGWLIVYQYLRYSNYAHVYWITEKECDNFYTAKSMESLYVTVLGEK